ncbi:MAG: YkgJ family cysteine cluster protein [Alphaproteobacteria bacterium]|nr:YkgJ family cysteine cluster protein [Alphaproteobacteria bacterium]
MPAAAEQLCLACGLCCNGALYDHAKVTDEERDRLAGAGIVGTDPAGLSLPCSAYRGGACQVYADRPSACRTFRCRLLRALDDGDVPLATALETVAKAKQLLRRGAEAGADLSTLAARQRIRRAGPDGGQQEAAAKARAARIYVEAVAVGLFLERHLRNDKDAREEPAVQPSA